MVFLSIALIVVILILLNALYVAAEFSTIATRKSRISQMADEGNDQAKYLLSIIEDHHKLDNYIASCQVGITISSVVLGFYGQDQVSHTLSPLLVEYGQLGEVVAETVATTSILIFFSILQILFGELIPKNIGIQYPEKLALLTLIPMQWSQTFFKPLIWLFNGSGVFLMRVLGIEAQAEHTHVHAPNEIVMLVEESGAGGVIAQEEQRLLKNTLKMRDTSVRQIMLPRIQILGAPADLPADQLFEKVANSNYSRLPVFRGSIDNIIGVVHLKDLLFLNLKETTTPINRIIRDTPFIPAAMPVRQAFSLLQRTKAHVAIVLDEYGGTSGLVTLEDLIEEIFGDLEDEFDRETPRFTLQPDGRLWIRGDVTVEEINSLLEIDLPDQIATTIGGLLQSKGGGIPTIGTKVTFAKRDFVIEKMTGRGISVVSTGIPVERIEELEVMLQ